MMVVRFIILKTQQKHFGESGGRPELCCSCMGSFSMAVPSQGHREAGNRVRVPGCFRKRISTFAWHGLDDLG